ncbi:MAG: hypothetical protein NUV54_02555, partial [Candidatus Taylorbacteria bacterium]|nr:hypothetical protein [Candidatus Taylorbacteria bacterium]
QVVSITQVDVLHVIKQLIIEGLMTLIARSIICSWAIITVIAVASFFVSIVTGLSVEECLPATVIIVGLSILICWVLGAFKIQDSWSQEPRKSWSLGTDAYHISYALMAYGAGLLYGLFIYSLFRTFAFFFGSVVFLSIEPVHYLLWLGSSILLIYCAILVHPTQFRCNNVRRLV